MPLPGLVLHASANGYLASCGFEINCSQQSWRASLSPVDRTQRDHQMGRTTTILDLPPLSLYLRSPLESKAQRTSRGSHLVCLLRDKLSKRHILLRSCVIARSN